MRRLHRFQEDKQAVYGTMKDGNGTRIDADKRGFQSGRKVFSAPVRVHPRPKPLFPSFSKNLRNLRIPLLLNLSLTLILLTSCQPSSFLSDRLPWNRGETEEVTVAELHFLGWPDSTEQDTRLQILVDAFNQANPTIHVNLELSATYDTALKGMLLGGDASDILLMDSFTLPQLVGAELLAPIENVAGTLLNQPDDFYPRLYQAAQINGILYCVPKEFHTLALIYNKALFDKAGLAYPNSNWRWDDLSNAAEVLASQPSVYFISYGIVLSADITRWLPLLYQAGGRLIDSGAAAPLNSGGGRDQSVAVMHNHSATLDALNFYVDMFDNGDAIFPAALNSSWNGEALGKGWVAMTIEGSWILPYLTSEFPNLKRGVVELPSGPNGRSTTAFMNCYGISAQSAHKEAAHRLIAHLTAPNNMALLTSTGTAMPPRASLRERWLSTHVEFTPFLEAVDYATVWQLPDGYERAIPRLNRGLEDAVTGEFFPEEVADEFVYE